VRSNRAGCTNNVYNEIIVRSTDQRKIKNKLFSFLYWLPRTIVVIFSLFWFVFALLSGAEELGGGFRGVLLNSPNAIPWLLFFGMVGISFKWPKIGGGVFVILGLFMSVFFDWWKEPLLFPTLILPVIVCGLLFWMSDKFRKRI
jgi:hypothetical protein